MMLDAVVVVGHALVSVQVRPDGLGQELRHRGQVGDELPPAVQRGQLQAPVIVPLLLLILGVRAGRGPAGHHGLSASANGSKIGIGMTGAAGTSSAPAVPAASLASSCTAAGGAPVPVLPEAAAVVRAATLRSLAVSVFRASLALFPDRKST